jgi:hypothetical protein
MDLLEIMNRGAQRAASLDDAVCLHKAAEQFLGAYAMFEGYDVVAASAIAERVLGAAMILKPQLSSGGQGRTVVFDVNIASGTQLARAARRLRDAGNADELVGIALHSLIAWNSDTPLGDLAQIVVAHDPDDDALGSWECGDRRHSGVGISL